MRGVIAGFLIVSTVGWVALAGPSDEIPTPFLPFEHMIGGWKGTAKPALEPAQGVDRSRTAGPGSSRRGSPSA